MENNHLDAQTYVCTQCGAQYLPYRKGITCPKCGAIAPEADTEEYEGFIDRLWQTMAENKTSCGKYVCIGLGHGTLAEDVQMIVFEIFDQIEEEQPVDIRKRIEEIISESNWRSRHYFKDHICAIAMEVSERWENIHSATTATA